MSAIETPGVWEVACQLDDLWENDIVGVRIGTRDVLLANIAGVVYAYADRCPHAGSRLSDGSMHGSTLRCAAHHWEFDIRTGLGVNPRTCTLEPYEVRISDGAILLRVA